MSTEKETIVPGYRARVVEEAGALAVKISALKRFLLNLDTVQVDEEDEELLQQQLQAMILYLSVLGKRIARFDKEPEVPVNTEYANDRVPKRWRSVAVWPNSINVGNIVGKNESYDDHDSEAQAEAVCGLLRREGFGGAGNVFPLSTRVEPVWN